MIIIRLMGGLGNQMFQYALAKKIQEQGKKVKLDSSYYEKIPEIDTKRYYELGVFKVDIPLANKKEIKSYYNLNELLKIKLRKLFPFVQSKILFENDSLHEKWLTDIDNKYLIGYWQNEKYFKDIRQKILENFKFDTEHISIATKQIYNQIRQDEISVSVHIRGGDYLNAINKSILGNVCTEEYYLRSCEYFKKKYKKVSFYIFTNDLELAKSYLKLVNQNIIFVNANGEKNSWEDMFLMSKCKHNIIANSTFSWWGAWLNQNPDKEVIAPLNWTSDGRNNNIIPDNWMRM